MPISFQMIKCHLKFKESIVGNFASKDDLKYSENIITNFSFDYFIARNPQESISITLALLNRCLARLETCIALNFDPNVVIKFDAEPEPVLIAVYEDPQDNHTKEFQFVVNSFQSFKDFVTKFTKLVRNSDNANMNLPQPNSIITSKRSHWPPIYLAMGEINLSGSSEAIGFSEKVSIQLVSRIKSKSDSEPIANEYIIRLQQVCNRIAHIATECCYLKEYLVLEPGFLGALVIDPKQSFTIIMDTETIRFPEVADQIDLRHLLHFLDFLNSQSLSFTPQDKRMTFLPYRSKNLTQPLLKRSDDDFDRDSYGEPQEHRVCRQTSRLFKCCFPSL